MKKIIKNIPYKILSRFKNLNPENAISLFCDPRGGSTWLAETLNSIPRSTIIDEPLHLNNSQRLKDLKFSWRQNIPENESWEEAKRYFELVLKGQSFNRANCYRNTVSEVAKSKQLILKIIRGKALLPWYVKQFNFKYTPLFVVRHPFAIAASQLSHGAWNYQYQKFEIPDAPFNDFYKQHDDYLYSLETKEEQLTALWCMGNNVVLHHQENDHSWITLNYENLILEPEKYFEQIFERWGMKIPPGLMDRVLNPSTTTVGKKKIDPKNLLSDWKVKLSKEQISRLQKVLDYFEVDYYGTEVMPLIPAQEIHLKKAKT